METSLSVRAAARAIGSDERTLRREIARGNLTVSKVSPHRARVALDELQRFVAANPERGWHEPEGSLLNYGWRQDEAPTGAAEPVQLVSNVAGVVAPAVYRTMATAADGFVTIPLDHYAALVAARAELEFIRAHFEFRWLGDVSLSSDSSKKTLTRNTDTGDRGT